jgi:hypothetical protein
MRKHGISIYLDYSFMSGGDLASRLYQDHPFDFLVTGEPGMHLTSNSEAANYRYMFQVFESPQYLAYRGSEDRQNKQILYVPGISTEEAVRLGKYNETAQLDFDEAVSRVHHLEEGQGLILWSHARSNIFGCEDMGYHFKEVQKFRNSFYCHNEYCKEEWRSIRDSFCSVFISCWINLANDSKKAMTNILSDRSFLDHFAALSSP